MKKILLVLAILMTMCLGATAQSDGFFRSDGNSDYNDRTSSGMPLIMSGEVGSIHDTDAAPLGSGLLILTALGAGYALRKKEA